MKQEPVGSLGLGSGQAQPAATVGYNVAPAPPAEVKPEGVAASENPTAICFLQRLVELNSEDVTVLEKGVAIGVKVLKNLQAPLQLYNHNTQAPHWLESIDRLLSTAKPTRTIVGVVGNTGAGKSSVISAVLDEER